MVRQSPKAIALEAIDFVEFYSLTALELQQSPACRTRPQSQDGDCCQPLEFSYCHSVWRRGSGVGSWEYGYSQACLRYGLASPHLVRVFWEAGVPREALQLVACSGSMAGAA